jgi:magnesium chelatase family protein
MRQPLEDRTITISRAKFTVDYPASVMLISSMNPCPCGFYNHPDKDCLCPPGMVQKYLSRISGPLLDRIDIHIEVTPVSFDKISDERLSEKSADIRGRVEAAREIQSVRFEEEEGIHSNAMMSSRLLRTHCQPNEEGMNLLKVAMEKVGLSARAYDRILKVSRTIADLEGSATIETDHLSEAIQYRSLDRDGWGG